jgi:phosphoesterase RecJ-like protein
VDVAAVATGFGGGGHRNAAGCTVPGTLADVKRRVYGALGKVLS